MNDVLQSVDAIQPHMKSLLLLEFQDGFYVKDKAAARALATSNASSSTLGYQKKPVRHLWIPVDGSVLIQGDDSRIRELSCM